MYLFAVIVLGLCAIGISLGQIHPEPRWFLLAGLTLVSGSAFVRLPGIQGSISFSEIFVFTAVLIYGSEAGPAAGTIIVALDALVISIWAAKRDPNRRDLHRALFNISAVAISLRSSSELFYYLTGVSTLSNGSPSALTPRIVAALIVFALAYFALNSFLVAVIYAFERRKNPFELWPRNFAWLSLNYLCGASVSMVLLAQHVELNVAYIGVVVPLLLLLYYTFNTSWARVQDANKQKQELNRLYLSTIETLAAAIDAKDQITHGHIRRVQVYAEGLAKSLGVSDEKLLKAIKAAALLHDMGKLAVPEYILNKPGKLTDAEFEKMKLHASVGADILKSIDFPYPVENIVRFHHECWDGTGYPRGLKGIEIPIGARILAVVDCFDALTSDRPYRPRLPDAEAIKILTERRGTMYDPLIVDTFLRVHHEIAPETAAAGEERRALHEIRQLKPSAAGETGYFGFEDIAASTEETVRLYELAQALAGQSNLSDAATAASRHLRRLIPSSLCAFYLYDVGADELKARHVTGEAPWIVKGLTIPLGQHLSGWVGANRQTIINSDPVLDLGEVARRATPRLRSCLSTPLFAGETLVGVLTLYSATTDGFTEDHRRIVEAAARQIGPAFQSTLGTLGTPPPSQPSASPTVTLPSITRLDELVKALPAGNDAQASLLLIRIVGPASASFRDRHERDELLQHIVRAARTALRDADILCQSGSDELVALLRDTDARTAAVVAGRVRDALRTLTFRSDGGEPLAIEAEIAHVDAPRSGEHLQDLVAAARRRVSLGTRASDIVH